MEQTVKRRAIGFQDQFLIELENQSKTCLLSSLGRVCVLKFPLKLRAIYALSVQQAHMHQHHRHLCRYWSSFSPPSKKKNSITKVHSLCLRHKCLTSFSVSLSGLSLPLLKTNKQTFRTLVHITFFQFSAENVHILCYTHQIITGEFVCVRSLVLLCFDAMLLFFYVFIAIKMSIECLVRITLTEEIERIVKRSDATY